MRAANSILVSVLLTCSVAFMVACLLTCSAAGQPITLIKPKAWTHSCSWLRAADDGGMLWETDPLTARGGRSCLLCDHLTCVESGTSDMKGRAPPQQKEV